MPVSPRAPHGEKVREILHSYHRKGSIGAIKHPSPKKAAAIANAIAYRMDRAPAVTKIKAKP